MEYVNGWQRRNPNLIIIGAYWHDDEPGGAHAHIDYIPVAHGYVRGPKTQLGLVKALGEQGFFKKGKATAQIQWEASENKALEEICNQHGIAVEHPQRGKNVEHKEKAQLKLEETIAQTQELVRYNEELNERCKVLERKLKQVDRAMQHAAKLARHSFKRRHTDKKFYTCDKTLIDKVLKAAEDIHQDIEAFIHTPIEVEQKFEEAEAVCNEAEEARRQAETEKRQWKQLVSRQEDIINDSAHELAQELVRSSEPDCTTETQRMKDLMQKVTYCGSTLWDYFMLLEQQRHERMLEQLQNDHEYDDDMEYDEN
jgi:nucleotide-binding universal stress UspA family protein